MTFKSWVYVLLFFYAFISVGQQDEYDILKRIQSYQVQADEFYNPGLFPSKRSWSFSNKSVEDNTIFFTASIIYTLRKNYGRLDVESQIVADSIIAEAIPNFKKYISRNEEVTYNFWQTVGPDLPFPNGSNLISNEKARLPDDFDTSVLVRLASERNDSIESLLKQKMKAYAARESRAKNKLITLDHYKDSKAYEVWFGKEMPQTFDICVMSNIMLYVFSSELSMNEYDRATIDLIKRMIQNKDHLYRTKEVAHHTSSPALICYHLARMMAEDSKGHFEEAKAPLIDDMVGLLEQPQTSEVEKMLLFTSLKWLGLDIRPVVDKELLLQEFKRFSFFTVNPIGVSYGESSILPTVSWVCEAYNCMLYLEFILVSKQ